MGLVLPADSAVAHRYVAGGKVVQQAAQPPTLAVCEEVAQMAAERLAIAKRLVACQEFAPQGGVGALVDEPPAQRLELWQGALELGLGRAVRAQRQVRLAGRVRGLGGRAGWGAAN